MRVCDSHAWGLSGLAGALGAEQFWNRRLRGRASPSVFRDERPCHPDRVL